MIITEVDPVPALEAAMDGFEVLPMAQAARIGDIFCTATGDKNVIIAEHMLAMKDGAILANTGHFNVEIEIPALRRLAAETRTAREFVEEFVLEDGRRIYLVADGRLVNLAAAEGHPASVMDMSFANQALVGRVRRGERGAARAAGVPGARGDRRRDRPPEARVDGHRDRHADRGAGALPRLVGRRDLAISDTSRCQTQGQITGTVPGVSLRHG